MIRLDMNVCALSPSRGNSGSHTRMPCEPQNSHRASVRWTLNGKSDFFFRHSLPQTNQSKIYKKKTTVIQFGEELLARGSKA